MVCSLQSRSIEGRADEGHPVGLWTLISPVARPIKLETMGNKKLAIDSSIWLYQVCLDHLASPYELTFGVE